MLPDRIKKKHVKGSARISTLRKSIVSMLDTEDEIIISDFIYKHYRIIVAEHKRLFFKHFSNSAPLLCTNKLIAVNIWNNLQIV